jgi:hypothetical protein
MRIDESALADLPLTLKRRIVQTMAEAAAHGVVLRIDTGGPRRSEKARLAGQASARARLLRNGSADPRSNREPGVPKTGTKRELNVNSEFTNLGTKRELSVNSEFTVNATTPPGPPSQISDLQRSQRESAREAPKPKAAAKTPKAVAWRRVPAGWEPGDQHRAIAAECCVPFELELAKFRDHEFSAPKRDPDATFRNWLRSARRPAPYSAAPLPAPAKIKYSTPAEIYRALGREA